jgi:hypothetical protein
VRIYSIINYLIIKCCGVRTRRPLDFGLRWGDVGVSVIFLLYCGLITTVPAFLFVHGLVGGGVVSLFVAILIALLAATPLAADQHRLPRLLNPAIVLGIAGALLLMLLQIVPMTGGPLMNPIWTSTAVALAERPAGSVTIDTGMTLQAISRLITVITIMLLAVMIGLHRSRAEKLLSLLTGIATLVSLGRIASFFPLPETFQLLPPATQSGAEAISIFGLVLTAAAIIRAYERSRSSRYRGPKPRASTPLEIPVALAAYLINLSAILCSGDPTGLFAALFGGGILLAVLTVRKVGLGLWSQAGATAVLALALVTFIAFMPGRTENELIARMAEDARPIGVGAGTLSALAPVYGNWPTAVSTDIPAAVTVAIEMGRPFLWLTVLIAIAWILILLRGSLLRGRDYVYSATGAGCIAAFLVSATSSGGGLSLAPSILLSATLGLAIAQSKGETSSIAPAPRLPHITSPQPRPFRWRFYSALVIVTLILTAQGAWILLPEVSRAAPIGFPSDQAHATVARQEQEKANRSAAMAVVRGDLWAESAFTYAAMLWTDQALELETNGDRNAKVSASLSKTLRYSPHRGDAWLMLASICERIQLQTCNIGALLKMSYYTAPDEAGLLPVRLAQVLHSKEIAGDDELADMARREIRFVLTRPTALRQALIAAYRSASPAGKLLVEQTVTPIDPNYLNILRAQLT